MFTNDLKMYIPSVCGICLGSSKQLKVYKIAASSSNKKPVNICMKRNQNQLVNVRATESTNLLKREKKGYTRRPLHSQIKQRKSTHKNGNGNSRKVTIMHEKENKY